MHQGSSPTKKIAQNGRKEGLFPAHRPHWLPPAWPLLLLAGLVVLFLADVLFAGKTLAMRDTFFDFLPWRRFVANTLGSGRLPMWNPLTGFGEPFAADPEAALFYPLNVLFYFLPAAWALKLCWALHLWIGGASMFALARHWRLQTPAALLAAVSFIFSTWMIAYMEFLTAFTAVVWGPLILLLTSHLVEAWAPNGITGPWLRTLAGNTRWSALLALALAAQYLAGQPEIVIQTLLMAGALVLVRSIYLRRWRVLGGTTVSLLLAGLLVLGLTLPQFLLNWELLQQGERAGGVDPGLDAASLHPKQLLSFLLPFLFGRPGYPNKYWGETMFEFWAGTCYLGLLPLMLGGFALFSLRRREASAESSQRCLVLFSVVLILFGLLMASGRYAPLYMWFHHLPLFDRIRWPSKYLLWTLYGLALLAGVGYQAIVTLTERGLAQKARWWAAGVAGAVFIALCAGYISARSGSHLVQSLAGSKAHLTPAHLQGVLADYLAGLVFFLLSFAVLLARMSCRTRTPWIDAAAVGLVFANLLFVSRQVQPVISDSVCQVGRPAFLRPERAGPDSGRIHSTYAWVQQWLYADPHADIFEWGQQAGLGNSWMPFGIYQSWPGGLGLERNLAVVAMLKDLPPAQAGHLADLLGIHWVLGGEKVEDILSRRVIPHFTLQERTNCLPRAYLAGRWQEIRDPLQVLPQMFSPSFVPGFDAVVEPTTSGPSFPSRCPPPLPTTTSPRYQQRRPRSSRCTTTGTGLAWRRRQHSEPCLCSTTPGTPAGRRRWTACLRLCSG